MVVQFDEQPTNRAGMLGLSDCSMLLEESTIAILQGDGEESPQCFCDYWLTRGPQPPFPCCSLHDTRACHVRNTFLAGTDDSTVTVYLTTYTYAAPGMAVSVRPYVLWPKLWALGGVYGSCGLDDGMCNTHLSMDVDAYFPCNQRATAEREECVVPVAYIGGPTAISSCPGTALQLDGSRSSGGGIKPLVFSWSAHPILSDSYHKVQPALSAAGDAERVSVSTELDGGRKFLFLLRVSSFLGVQSDEYEFEVLRDPLPIPTISIEAPPVFTFRSSTQVSVQGKATLPICFTGAYKAIAFTWSNPSTVSTYEMAPREDRLALGVTAGRRDLALAGSDLTLGMQYTLLLTYSDGSKVDASSTKVSIKTYHWTMSPPDADLRLLSVCSTGPSQANLVLLPNSLRAGASYIFELTAIASNGRQAFARVKVLMNRAPFGGKCVLEYDPPALALQSDILLAARQWFDDDPSDYPLSFSFSYLEDGVASTRELGKRSYAPSAMLRKPSEGNLTIFCYVYDSYLAVATMVKYLPIKPGSVLNPEATGELLGSIQSTVDEGDVDGSSQLVSSIAATLNKDADRRRRRRMLLSATGAQESMMSEEDYAPHHRRLSTLDEGQASEARENLMDFVVSTGETASNDPLVTKQRAGTVELLVQTTEETSSGLLDKGAELMTGLIGTSKSAGEMAEGGAGSMVSALGLMLKGGNAGLATARRDRRLRAERRALLAVNASSMEGGLGEDGRNMSAAELAAAAAAAEAAAEAEEEARLASMRTETSSRSGKLVNATKGLNSALAGSLMVGEEPLAVSTPELSTSVGKNTGCALEGAALNVPSSGGLPSGGVMLPTGTTCSAEARRRYRRARKLASEVAPSVDGVGQSKEGEEEDDDDEEDAVMETAFTSFNNNPYMADSEEEASTPVNSIELREGGADTMALHINGTNHIIIRIPLRTVEVTVVKRWVCDYPEGFQPRPPPPPPPLPPPPPPPPKPPPPKPPPPTPPPVWRWRLPIR